MGLKGEERVTTQSKDASAPAAPAPVAASLDGKRLADEIAALGVTHVITVPDTNLKTAISALDECASLRMLYVCTEDEGMGINAGLYMAGQKPMMLIQNNGLHACLNTLKSIALEAEVPTFMVIGQYGRDVTKTVETNRLRAVRLLEPTLETWGVPFYRLDQDDQFANVRIAYEKSFEIRGPSALIVGAPTR
jgi:sulfopyruvate decarboxylase TPP-binding subunit